MAKKPGKRSLKATFYPVFLGSVESLCFRLLSPS